MCTSCPRNTVFDPKRHFFCSKISKKCVNRHKSLFVTKKRMFGLKIFVQVQTFRRVPPVLPCNSCHRAFKTEISKQEAGMLRFNGMESILFKI